MDNLVIIKSNKYGILVHLDKDAPYEELLREIERKFKEASKFFEQSKMAVSFEGRILTKAQEQELIRLISETAQIHIICLIDSNEQNELTYKSVVDQCLEELHFKKRDGQFYKGTLAKRQTLESDTSIVILGDVESGARVAAKGNIIVIGTIYGDVQAGAAGNKSCFVAALGMQPQRLRIGDIRLQHTEYLSMEPQIVTLENETFFTDALI